MSITTYATLKTAVADWLNRSDLTSAIADFVQIAEAGLKRDDRLRKHQYSGSISVSADGYSLPSDFQSLEALAHDGTTYFGPVEIVGADQLGALKGQYGSAGVPRYAAIVDGVLYFAPEPDGAYALTLTYWRKITDLSDSNTTNWLLTAHPDVYLYGALVQAGVYLKDADLKATAEMELERRIQSVHTATWNASFSGTMRRQFKAFGG